MLLTPSKKPGNAKFFYTILDQSIKALSTTPQNSEAFIDGFTWSRVVNFKTNLPYSSKKERKEKASSSKNRPIRPFDRKGSMLSLSFSLKTKASVASAALKEEVLVLKPSCFHSRRDGLAKYADFELVQSSAIFEFPS